MLNVGYRHNSNSEIYHWCRKHKRDFNILEAHKPNVDWCTKNVEGASVINGDVRDIDTLVEDNKYDFIIWLHGPEHVTWKEFTDVRLTLEKKSRHGVIYQAPLGERPQGNLYGNPFEVHKAVLYPHVFQKLGYAIAIHDTNTEHCFSAYKVW